MEALIPHAAFPERIRSFLALIGEFAIFLAQVLRRLPTRPFFLREIIDATALVATRCFFPVVMVLAPFGMVFALHGSQVLGMFGAEPLLGFMVGVATFRELAPNLTAVLIAAQAGSAFTAELAAMQAQEEIDATIVMGVDPIKFHVIPRILGITLAAPILTFFAGATGIMGGWFLAIVGKHQDGGAFWDSLFSSLSLFDFYAATIKATTFGAIIGTLGAFLGYRSRGDVQAVGDAVNNTVVYAITLFLLTNYFLSTALFGIAD